MSELPLMAEKTSAASFSDASRSGMLRQIQRKVLDFVTAHPPCSQGDVSRYFGDASSSYQPRFRELEDAGLIEQRGAKLDAVTGRIVKAYWPTGKPAAAPTRRKRRKVRATMEPAGGGLFRIAFTPAVEIAGPVEVQFSLAI